MQAPVGLTDTMVKSLVDGPIILHDEAHDVLVKRSPKGHSVANGIVNLGKLQANVKAWQQTKESVVKNERTAKVHKEMWEFRVEAYDNYVKADALARQYRIDGKTLQSQAWQARADEIRDRPAADPQNRSSPPAK